MEKWGYLLLKFDNYLESCFLVEVILFDGVFFRLCKGENFCEEDFFIYFEVGKSFLDKKLCEVMVLLFFDSYDYVEKLKKRFRKKFVICFIKFVVIIEDYGVGIFEENLGYFNLWEYRNVDIFVDLMKEDKGKDE